MDLKSLILAFHERKALPKFNRAAHGRFLGEKIDGFKNDNIQTANLAAVREWAATNGFQVRESDYDFRYTFIPDPAPEDIDTWAEEDAPRMD